MLLMFLSHYLRSPLFCCPLSTPLLYLPVFFSQLQTDWLDTSKTPLEALHPINTKLIFLDVLKR